jgi:putative peptide zinc metalloprotease protein
VQKNIILFIKWAMPDFIPPSFRKDLKLYPGPKEPNGAPTYNLYDPITAKYYKLGWAESSIYKLAREGMSFAEIANEINLHSTFLLTEEDIDSFYHQSAYLGLLNLPKSSQQVSREFEKSKGSVLWWTLMHYLYFRLPLFKPDTFLERTLPYVKPLWSTPAIIIYCLAAFLGLSIILTHFDAYFRTFTYFFNFEGALMYAAAIFCIKIIHELAHAYTAKNYKIQVPSIGVAVIVLWPVLYTDVTDSWKLANRKQRLAISIAGVVSELVIAGISTFGWAMTSPGILQSIFFLLSSTTWITSLFINFNPAMRFDGYYILSDLWGIDNLRQRSFAITRWKLREWFFGLNIPCPEEDLSPKRIRGMVIYSLYTWFYLLTVYTLIAVFVYYEFAKALGIILFLLEIAIFFVWPVVGEFQDMYRLRNYFHFNVRTVITLSCAILISLWFLLPLPRHVYIPSITVPTEEQVLYGIEEGRIKNIYYKQGDMVAIGDPIIEITQTKLDSEIHKKKEDVSSLAQSIQTLSMQPDQYSTIPEKQVALLSLVDQLEVLNATQHYLLLKAKISGKLFSLDDTLRVDQPISKNQILGKIANTNQVSLVAFIPEHLINDFHPGQKVEFRLHNSSTRYYGTVSYIESTPALILEYPSLASKFKGPLAVTIDRTNNSLKLIDGYFQAKISLDPSETPLRFGKIGEVVVSTPPESLFMRGLKHLYALFIRESSL